jgi:hypothetical protein
VTAHPLHINSLHIPIFEPESWVKGGRIWMRSMV